MSGLLLLCAALAAGPASAPPASNVKVEPNGRVAPNAKVAPDSKVAPDTKTNPDNKAHSNTKAAAGRSAPPPAAPVVEGAPVRALEPATLSGPGLGSSTSLGRVRSAGHGGTTSCAACHATSSWTEVRFNHERTGFPLTGLHARTTCKSCHPSTFEVPVPSTCQGCHRDVHAGELGARCEACHDTTDWRSRFDADAHRRTNFPLLGGHAALPCTECHGEARERRFSRAAVDCLACHAADAQRTAGLAVDHLALGFATQSCRQCHGARAFAPARFPSHDGCFPISAGAHAGVACAGCHDGFTSRPSAGPCSTGTANKCVGCHTNSGSGGKVGNTDALHSTLMGGYAYGNVKRCAECHKGTGVLP